MYTNIYKYIYIYIFLKVIDVAVGWNVSSALVKHLINT